MNNNDNLARTDDKTFEIFDYFQNNLAIENKFSLYGHSAGGQFVSRFMMIYPEYLINVGMSAAGTILFPQFNHCYPYSFNLDLIDRYVQVDPDYPTEGQKICGGFGVANDFKSLNEDDFNNKIKELLKLNVLLIAGEKDDVGNCNDRPETKWQGCYVPDKTKNLYYNLSEKAKELGVSFENVHLEILPSIGHDWKADGDFAKKYFYSEQIEECIESWICGNWSNCVNGTQVRNCFDVKNCGTILNKPQDSQICFIEEEKNESIYPKDEIPQKTTNNFTFYLIFIGIILVIFIIGLIIFNKLTSKN